MRPRPRSTPAFRKISWIYEQNFHLIKQKGCKHALCRESEGRAGGTPTSRRSASTATEARQGMKRRYKGMVGGS
jgi:hypothetical protein